MNHTPGPWVVEQFDTFAWTVQTGLEVLCTVRGEGKEAFARLISAAPDLLAACRRLLEEHTDCSSCDVCQPAYDAFEKAGVKP